MQVELRSEIGPWIVWRRYRQFHELDAKLRARFPAFAAPLPSKKMGGNLNPQFIEERRQALETYLSAVVEDSNAAGSADFRAFIDANRSCTGKLSDAVGFLERDTWPELLRLLERSQSNAFLRAGGTIIFCGSVRRATRVK